MDILDIFLDILLKPPQPLIGLFFIPFVDSRAKAIESHSGLMYAHYEKI